MTITDEALTLLIRGREALNEAEMQLATDGKASPLTAELSGLLDELDGIIVEFEPDAVRYGELAKLAAG